MATKATFTYGIGSKFLRVLTNSLLGPAYTSLHLSVQINKKRSSSVIFPLAHFPNAHILYHGVVSLLRAQYCVAFLSCASVYPREFSYCTLVLGAGAARRLWLIVLTAAFVSATRTHLETVDSGKSLERTKKDHTPL